VVSRVAPADGYVLTNHHVVDGAEEIKVELTNNRVYEAKVVGLDPRSDLAVLKIVASDLALLTLGDIVAFNGNQITNGNSLRNLVASAGPGAEATLTVLREGREQQLRATLDELSDESGRGAAPARR
jgi:S1-C subfamily serine protease